MKRIIQAGIWVLLICLVVFAMFPMTCRFLSLRIGRTEKLDILLLITASTILFVFDFALGKKFRPKEVARDIKPGLLLRHLPQVMAILFTPMFATIALIEVGRGNLSHAFIPFLFSAGLALVVLWTSVADRLRMPGFGLGNVRRTTLVGTGALALTVISVVCAFRNTAFQCSRELSSLPSSTNASDNWALAERRWQESAETFPVIMLVFVSILALSFMIGIAARRKQKTDETGTKRKLQPGLIFAITFVALSVAWIAYKSYCITLKGAFVSFEMGWLFEGQLACGHRYSINNPLPAEAIQATYIILSVSIAFFLSDALYGRQRKKPLTEASGNELRLIHLPQVMVVLLVPIWFVWINLESRRGLLHPELEILTLAAAMVLVFLWGTVATKTRKPGITLGAINRIRLIENGAIALAVAFLVLTLTLSVERFILAHTTAFRSFTMGPPKWLAVVHIMGSRMIFMIFSFVYIVAFFIVLVIDIDLAVRRRKKPRMDMNLHVEKQGKI